MKRYVLAMAFDESHEHVVLVRKNRPDWQAGKWNGVGGHIEEGESATEAIAREFLEETGVHVPSDRWIPMGEMGGEGFNCRIFSYFGDEIRNAQTCTDEIVRVCTVAEVRARAIEVVDPNVYVMINLALLPGPMIKEIYLAY